MELPSLTMDKDDKTHKSLVHSEPSVANPDEDSDEQATPPLSQAGASKRTATSKPRLLSPRPAPADAL